MLSCEARLSNLPARSSAFTVSLSPNVDTTVLVLSPLGKQVVSVELIPDEGNEVRLKLPLFLPRLKVEATSSSSTSFTFFFWSGKRDRVFLSGLCMQQQQTLEV